MNRLTEEEIEKQEKGTSSPSNTTQAIALEFCKRALTAIEGQLKIEVKRNGFSYKDLETGKAKLIRKTKTDEKDSRFVQEGYSIKKDDVEKLIMVVKWTPNSYQIERKGIHFPKLSPTIRKTDTPPLVTGKMTPDEIDIEARAAEYERVRKEQEKTNFLKKI